MESICSEGGPSTETLTAERHGLRDLLNRRIGRFVVGALKLCGGRECLLLAMRTNKSCMQCTEEQRRLAR